MEKYIEATTFTGSDFKVMTAFEGWKIGFLRYSDRFSDFKVIERHNETDEVFVLLEGTATLYVEDESVEMEKCTVYNVKKGLWHHIVVSQDATVMVVENSNTSLANTERRSV